MTNLARGILRFHVSLLGRRVSIALDLQRPPEQHDKTSSLRAHGCRRPAAALQRVSPLLEEFLRFTKPVLHANDP